MAQSRFVVGDYVVEKQIGSGSFSTVWQARHRVRGTEVAIKEIITGRLNSKLQENLKSEIVILQKINHPNIIRLHHMIEEAGKIYIVLDYCRGGDLSMYIQKRQGRISEATAKHFMQQLASGLKILRENNLIHRDLKPQNLLLSAEHDTSTLKIADFGFARSLQPRVLAETLCGSPLYMAPEIMQLKKYDAKADLWSVGAILFQLVTGKTPFTGNNQIQLLQNIVKSTELQFPLDVKNLSSHCTDLCRKLLRLNPVERLTFEEFFNHPFLSQKQPEQLCGNQRPQRVIDDFSLTDCNPLRCNLETFQEDSSEENLKESSSMDHRLCSKDSTVADSFELIEREYVLVSVSLMDSSASAGGSRLSNAPFRSSCSLQSSGNIDSKLCEPVLIVGPSTTKIGHIRKLESPSSAPGASQGSTYIESLQHSASAITELVNEKIAAGRYLEAFSIELVVLAIWKYALHICNSLGPENLFSYIERAFLNEVGKAEELSKHIEPGNTEVPDAMEMIFQYALDFGRKGAVDEYMGRTEIAIVLYSKAVCLLAFLQVEAPLLILNPPFLLTNSDRYRLGSYIDLLNNRQSASRSQRMTLLKCED